MNVEGGTISAGVGGPSIGGGVGVSVGPAVGPSIGIGSTIVNEGPVAPAFLENTMPLPLNNFKPIGEIIFNPFRGGPSVVEQAEQAAAVAWENPQAVSVVEQAEMVAAKAWELPVASQGQALEATKSEVAVNSIVKTAEPAIVSFPESARGLDEAPKVETVPLIMQESPESRATKTVTRVILTPTQSQVQTEQVVEEEKVFKKDKKEDQTQARKSEKQSVSKIKFTEAVRISKNRISALKEALKKTKTEGLSTKWLRKFLGKTYWGQQSPIAREGFDGTLEPTVRELEAYGSEIKSDQEAENASAQAVSNHIPVEAGEGGRPATEEEVREVREGKEKEAIRLQTPAEMVIKRVVVKKDETSATTGQVVNTLVEEKEEVAGEPTLKSLGLEELFPKVA